jgi:tetratricopeptide (TPR) repeat protein
LVELTRPRLELAVRHQQAGRLHEAAAIYQELLQASPGDADLMQRLGVALAQSGLHAEGAQWLARSLQLSPKRPTVLLNLARTWLAMGLAEDALHCCDEAIALDGAVPHGHRLRGAALAALGRSQEALAHLGQAVRLAPTDAGALIELGVLLASGDRPADAVACFERAVALDPLQIPAHHNLALMAARQGDHERALQSFDRALALDPHNASLLNNRGASLKALGRLAEALQSHSQAVAIEPGNGPMLRNRAVLHLLLEQYPAAIKDYRNAATILGEQPLDLIGLGTALLALDRHDEALAPLDKAAALLPDEIEAHIQRGVALLRLERHAEAVASFDRALAMERRTPVLNNRGVALAALGRSDEALQSFIESAAHAGGIADTHTNMGVVFKSLGDYRQAGLQFDRALSIKHDDPAANFESAFLRLTLGNFRQGWPQYEARFRVPALHIPQRNFRASRWLGKEAIAGKTLLVHAEQGLGDTIQFARYVPLLRERGADVVFEVLPSLKALMGSLPGQPRIIARGDAPPPLDFHCPLLSLPLAFDTQLDTIPTSDAYLTAEPARAAFWKQRLQQLGGLRVGVAWQGNAQVERLIWARGRSMPLTALAPLAAVTGVALVSLQKGPGAEQLLTVPFRDRIVDLGTQFDGGADAFLDSAAVMANLDLVITTDTSIAHLAGALGRPVWVALNCNADWRWLLDRTDSPWYPSMRLFRQPDRTQGWDPVIAELSNALAVLATPS